MTRRSPPSGNPAGTSARRLAPASSSSSRCRAASPTACGRGPTRADRSEKIASAMSLIYELIGRWWVGLIRQRYRDEIRAAAAVGVGLTVIAIGAYLATRSEEEEEA